MPPQLAEQWQRELAEKFHIEAELILSSTIQRLERDLPIGVSCSTGTLYHRLHRLHQKLAASRGFYPQVSRICHRRRGPRCTLAGALDGRQQRFELLRRVAEDRSRHLVLVTATPTAEMKTPFVHFSACSKPSLPTCERSRPGGRGVRRKLARHLCKDAAPTFGTIWRLTPPSRAQNKTPEPTYTSAKNTAPFLTTSLPLPANTYRRMTAPGAVDGCGTGRRLPARCVSSSPAAAAPLFAVVLPWISHR